MPVDNEGRFYRTSKVARPANPSIRKNPDTSRQSVVDSEELGIVESIGTILGFVICIALVGVAAYGTWIGIVWLYFKVVALINFIYENRQLILGIITLLVLAAFRSIFD